MIEPLLDADGVARLRAALTTAGYTSAGIAGRIGPEATAAMRRNDYRAALRATGEGDPLGTLIRLFVCAQSEPAEAVARALDPLPPDAALAAGLVTPTVESGQLRAGVDLEPYGEDWWVLADLPAGARTGPLPVDHVLGVGGASTTLAGATVRDPVGTALDLGTGCGIQALHLSTHARRVTATDVAPRALRFAATTAALAGLDWELLAGDLTVPVAGRRFDLVVSNPPFIVGPGGPARYVYRDSGRSGDGVCAELAAAAPDLLTDGGTMQYLANWLHVSGEPWQERVASWVAGTGLDAWVVQREVTDPMSYVNLWLSDAGESDRRLAAEWLDWFDAHKVEAVGFGVVNLRRAGHDDPVVRLEDLRQPFDQRLGEHVSAWFERQSWLRAAAGDLLAHRYRAAPGLRLRQEASLGHDGWAVDRQVLALADGLRWSEEVDPLVLALVGGCDGALPLRDQIDLLAAAHQVAPAELAEVATPIVAHLVERGFLAAGG
ncbi:MAG TPA: methyltransferase [Rugosimonospora sp.]|nr:methyltransferase [Rugosimonospora sp.]